jgi:sugar phosphate isomerase/epimerase
VPSSPDLSVQLYTVRSALATDADATLARLAGLGFGLVEPFALLEHRVALREGLARHGLTAPTTHADLLGPDRDAVFAAARELGIGTVIQAWTEPARWASPAGIAATAAALGEAARVGADLGIRVGYHNHEFELATTIDGRHALEVFADHLDSAVVLEVDTWWALIGGADVPALLERLGERVVALHLKDGDGSGGGHVQVPLGQGVLPVREILAAAPAALRVLELDDTAGDLFDAIRIGRDLLLGIGADGRTDGG